MGVSQNALARAAGVPPRRINEIVLGKRSITADTAFVSLLRSGPASGSGSDCRPTMTSRKRSARSAGR